METLTIKSPADVLSFIGHTLGFWPRESLVCITLDYNHVGATLRVDIPRHGGGENTYARRNDGAGAGNGPAMVDIPPTAPARGQRQPDP